MTLVLDAGALIAVERADRPVALVLLRARLEGIPVAVPAPVWAQVWRGGPRQALLARLRKALQTPLVPFDATAADDVGALLAATGGTDVVDAHVVVVARALPASVVLTSDPGDLRALDDSVALVEV